MKYWALVSKLRAMYEKHFGLHRRPFLAKVSGSDVFVGPQTAYSMAALRKALQVQDAVVLVAGAPGCGKSTVTLKALDALSTTHRAVRIGRMSLRGTDVLEYLLEELGETQLPNGPIRQFTLLREKLAQLESDGTRVVIVVEDALRLGVESLAELEALTAADAGESGGAALVVMGDARLVEFLPDPQLTRLAQRMQHSVQIRPMSEPEMRGYLLHCVRLAGGDYEQVLAPDAAAAIRGLSQGIPRVANKIVDAAMSAAAATGTRPISASLVCEVARDEFGLKTAVAPGTVPAPEPVPDTAPENVSEPMPEVVAAAEAGAATPAEPDSESASSDEPCTDLDDEIPELIQDTLPDLEILTPEIAGTEPVPRLAASPEPPQLPEGPTLPELQPEPELATLPEPANEPNILGEPPAAGESDARAVPEWEQDPTLAELVPDLDALEKAMSVAQGKVGDDAPPDVEDMPILQPEDAPESESREEIPEITLDNAIQERIEDNLIDEPGAVSPGPDSDATASHSNSSLPDIKPRPRKAKQADAELDRIASELTKAKTIEDVSDKLAETLFGEELSLAAAEVAARVRAEQSANDEGLSLSDTKAAPMSRAVGAPVADGVAEDTYEVVLAVESYDSIGGSDLSASQRLNTVRSLNTSDSGVSPDLSDAARQMASTADRSTPDPIEDQINTSMTQTLKALDVQPPVLDRTARFDEDEEDDFPAENEKKGGFFSRFRLS